jgi:GTP-binding protein Era
MSDPSGAAPGGYGQPPGHRSGFVGIIGRPNVGKSTLLNYYLGEKVAIISPKPQTTRHRILGVLTRPDAQVAFLDTPGLHEPEHALGRHMQEVAKAVIEEADVILAMVDGRAGLTPDDERLFSRLRHVQGRPVVLAINKVDIASKPALLPLLDRCFKTKLFQECVPVSAQTGEQMDVLLRCLIARLPEGPRWYEPDQRTDQTDRQRITELIREQVLAAARAEVPHAVGVLLDEVEPRDRVTAIRATLLVERQGQKAILIGKGGSMLKTIGQAARAELERLLGRKVMLLLWVKVQEDWRSDERVLRELGYLGGKSA